MRFCEFWEELESEISDIWQILSVGLSVCPSAKHHPDLQSIAMAMAKLTFLDILCLKQPEIRT